MLNTDSLAQLKQLKTEIQVEERRYEGIVNGSQSTFGFVRVDQGPQHFLPPQEMQKVFPGDRIKFQLKTDDQNRQYAAVQKLISSELQMFCGKCVQHGKAWFVEMDVPKLNRKLFLPPPQRKGVKPGDWLQCQVSRHPVKEGKGQARVKQILGQDSAPDFPSRYAAINFHLPQASELNDDPGPVIAACLQQRPDHSTLPLVSIDPPDTGDIDDALFARALDQGWELVVAIADPGAVIAPGSNADSGARLRAATAYLPHQQLPMLQRQLSEQLLSLRCKQQRPAILCRMTVSPAGEVTDARFEEAGICSRAQLSYQQLDQYFEQQRFPDTLDADTCTSLQALKQVSERLRQWRGEHQLLVDNKPEFRMNLNPAGRIESFSEIYKGSAHVVVEECMVATNQAAARKLEGHGGLFSSHAGFRPDRLSDAEKLLRAAGFEDFSAAEDLNTLEVYRAALNFLSKDPQQQHQRDILSRFLQRATLSASAAPHLGMGASSYLNFTSPLRRYVDLFNHMQMKRLLRGEAPLALEARLVEQLEAQLSRLRAGTYWAEQWLKCDYIERDSRQHHSGRVVQANPFGLAIRLDGSGIDGILEKRQLAGKMKFNSARLRFSSDEQNIGLDDVVEVAASTIKRDKRQLLFKLVEPAATPGDENS